MTQQYTCPKCLKNYVKATIHEHYECGVEPEEEEPIVFPTADEIIVKAQMEAARIIGEAMKEAEQIKAKAQADAPNIEPKKRGPKPKSKSEGEE